jgi:hypothetical protein
MEEPKQTDHALTVVILMITGMVFVLDLFLPSEVAIWALYIIPLGLTRWSSVGQLTFILSGACTVLIVLGHLYSPPGTAPDVALFNRGLGVVMVWAGAFFLKFGRI